MRVRDVEIRSCKDMPCIQRTWDTFSSSPPWLRLLLQEDSSIPRLCRFAIVPDISSRLLLKHLASLSVILLDTFRVCVHTSLSCLSSTMMFVNQLSPDVVFRFKHFESFELFGDFFTPWSRLKRIELSLLCALLFTLQFLQDTPFNVK
jgi:hypothetical protein